MGFCLRTRERRMTERWAPGEGRLLFRTTQRRRRSMLQTELPCSVRPGELVCGQRCVHWQARVPAAVTAERSDRWRPTSPASRRTGRVCGRRSSAFWLSPKKRPGDTGWYSFSGGCECGVESIYRDPGRRLHRHRDCGERRKRTALKPLRSSCNKVRVNLHLTDDQRY